ncbi:thymidine phosphorylase [Granulicella paludicola]|uniref:thymidine phosphorylase n=1 Tax=Granulicella paludicola TaxID=474951 RepID=UPI0021E04810|nr:thymidine phosphorylase [Granulicella paludicola]
MHPIDLILRKRDGLELSTADINAFVQAVTALSLDPKAATLTEAQLGAFLMAVFQRGLSLRETADLTTAMRFSGEVFDTKPLNTFSVDKHSTGGVGDKTSLLIAPTLAAAGLENTPSISVPMISGRSLGHTGGTLDKLETIPGFDTQLTLPQMMEVLRDCHAVLVGQTPRLVPADRILYAMRDHTGTVESPFLICASIMSKKLAEDLNGLVLDVKVGSGAFMPTYEKSKFLAELMVATGERSGTRTAALLTTMDEPLGRFSGNWVEVWECVDILQNKPISPEHQRMSADLITLSNTLSGWMLYLAGKSATPEAGALLAAELIRSGGAYKSWLQIVAAHHGDTSVFANPALFHKPAAKRVLTASRNGYLSSMDCKEVGWAVQRLGAGRAVPGGPVSAHVGIESHAKLGDRLTAGQPIFTLFTEDPALLDEPYAMLQATVTLTDTPPTPQLLIREIVTAATLP